MTVGAYDRRDADGYLSGFRLGEVNGQGPIDHGPGRRCAREDCTTKLNRYNPGPNCHRCGEGDAG